MTHTPRKWLSLWFVGVAMVLVTSIPQAQALNHFFIPPAGAAGDFNNSGTVDPADLPIWESSYAVDAGADADNDADSDGNDYLIWQRNLGLSSALVGDWEDPNFWFNGGNIVGLPGQGDRATIHANRTANLSTDVGFIADMRIGDTANPPGGTLNINAGGKVTTLDQTIMGASNPGFFKTGELNLNGGTLVTFGALHVAFEPGATETVNIAPGSLLDVNSDLFGRFGTATINQTGGTVDVQNNVIWGEGGDGDGLGDLFTTRSEYNLSGGELIVGNTLAIGGSIGIPRPDSDGRVNVTGGMVTAGDLVFDTFPGEEAILNIEGSGIVRIDQANYSEADANADIGGGFIIGTGLSVSTVVDGASYTQIVSQPPLSSLTTAVPEPTTACLSVIAIGWGLFSRQQRVANGCRLT